MVFYPLASKRHAFLRSSGQRVAVVPRTGPSYGKNVLVVIGDHDLDSEATEQQRCALFEG